MLAIVSAALFFIAFLINAADISANPPSAGTSTACHGRAGTA
ncbi:hypothetical protein [Streptomyces sp. NPDC001851]